ncbi:MAG: lamin tail domain-containing protein [Pirellulales bacterium]
MKRCFAGRRGRFSSVVSIAKSLWQSREAESGGAAGGSVERRYRRRANRLEQLEPRTMLAADFLITEFMASNGGTLLDADGDSSDWIEIQNVGNSAGSLAGWRLADSADTWVFPNESVPAGGFIVVFASNKNRSVAGAELHANFALAAEGERLALLRPDQSVRQEFDPYPAQFEDVSYGIVQDAKPLVPSRADATFRVPTPGDSGAGTSWTAPAFDDESWTNQIASGNRSVLITEVSTGSTDWYEIQNVSGQTLNTSGWVVAINHETATGTQNINLVDSAGAFTIGPTLAAGQIRYRTENSADTANYFGRPINWATASSKGWLMIVNDSGGVEDFVVWGYSGSELGTLNVTVNGFNITSSTIAAAWNGNPVNYAGTSNNSLQRQGNSDDDNSTDWIYRTPTSQNAQNTGLTLPVGGTPTPVTTGIGFNTNPSGFTVNYYKANILVTDTFVAETVIADQDLQTVTAMQTVATINYMNTAGGANFGGDIPFPTQTIGPDINDFVIEATATIVIPAPGQWTFGVNSDDGFTLELTNGVNTFNMSFIGPRGPGDTLQTFNFPTAGVYQARLVYFERGGGAEVELFAAQGAHGAFNSNFELVGDTAGGGLSTAGFGGTVATNVQSQMMGVNSSLWARIPFSVANPANLTSLSLRMKYNDGFIAYLNGVEVARQNANSTAWNASATGARDDGQSSTFVDFNITQFLHLLQAGENVLAIHGQNITAANNTFLVLPELVGTSTEPEQRYFTTPTPDSNNLGQGAVGFVGDTTFSHERGFYTSPFDVTIDTPTAGAVIRYTLDGSDPTETNGSIYSDPITITGTSTLRAAAFLPSFAPSNIDTQTYLFLSDVITQSEATPPGWPTNNQFNGQDMNYGMDPQITNSPVWGPQMAAAMTALPSLSIVTPLENLFDPSSGIYVNARGEGDSWEVPTSLELINPDGSQGFQIDAGLRIRGGFSRTENNPKHSFRLFFRKEYGAGELNYALFGDEGVDAFDKVDLRTAQNYSWAFQNDGSNVMVEEVWNRDTSRDMGQDYTRSRWYHLYINGQYWGLYQTEERPDQNFAESYVGGDADTYDVIKAEAGPYITVATHGNMTAWTQFYNLANTMRTAPNDTARYAIYMQLQGKNPDGTRNPAYPVLLDVDNLIEYMQAIFYSGDRDAPISNFLSNQSPNNWYGFRDRNGDEGFRFILHDGEHTLTHGIFSPERTGPWPAGDPNGNGVSKSTPQWIHQMLMYSPEYRLHFADLARDNFFDGGVFTQASALARFNARAAEIETAIIAESARWGDSRKSAAEAPFTKNNWVSASTNTRNFFNSRAATTITAFRNARLYGTNAAAPLYPAINAPLYNQYGGQVPSGFNLLIGNTSGGTIYYTTDGSDPRLVGGGISPSAQVYSGGVPITSSRVVSARVLVGGTWSALTTEQFSINAVATPGSVAIAEINYNPANPSTAELAINANFVADDFEFIELRNISNQPIELTGTKFTAGITFSFPATNGPTLTPGQNLVLVKNVAAFQARYGTSIPVGGVFTASLANGGEQIALSTASNQILVDLEFGDSGDWPGRPDGDGSTLVIVNPSGDPNDPDNWRSSTEYGGSPGSAGLAAVSSIVVNEVLTHTDSPLTDAVELYNPTEAAINIGGWYLSDGNQPAGVSDGLAEYKKFRIPHGTIIQPGAYLVFDEDDFNPNPDVHPSFSFNSAEGDDVYLVQADPNTGKLLNFIDNVDFGAAVNGESFGRWFNGTGDLYPMQSRTLGAANSGPRIGPVIISELMYNPQSGNDDLEYVELVNITDAAINLAGWKFDAGIDFTFGATTIPARGTLVVLRFDPANPGNAAKLNAFRAAYPSLPQNAQLVGGYAGVLNGGVLANGGETVRLSRPDVRQPGGLIPYLLVDEVKYDDVAPWPTSPDGAGPSLARMSQTIYGNEPTNWTGAAGSPGVGPVSPSLGAPTNLVATATAANRIQLSWTDNSTGETGFKIERFQSGDFVQVATVGANETSYEQANLQSSVNYTYRVRAFNAAGDSPASNTANATTPQLTRITGTAGHDTYHVLRMLNVLQVYENTAPVGQPTYSTELFAIRDMPLTIDAGAGNDALTVNVPFQPLLGVEQLIYNAGAGDNTLVLVRGSAPIDSTAIGGTLNTTVQADAHLTTSRLSQHGLVVQANGSVTLLPDGETSVITSLTLGGTAEIDIGNNALVIDYTGASPVATVRAEILAGRGGSGLGASWNGFRGIKSGAVAQANATEPESRSIGYAENAALPLGAYTTFRGVPVDNTSVLLAYTRTADANLDGFVNDDDVTVLGASYAPTTANAAWALGDFEYNGFVDDDDATLLGAFYNPVAAPAPPALIGPEDRQGIAPVATATRQERAERPGATVVKELSRSGGPTPNRASSAGPSDLTDQESTILPGPYGPGYYMSALRAYENRSVQLLDDAVDLIARELSQFRHEDSLAERPVRAAARKAAFEQFWAGTWRQENN